ncbi:uncharacterized protein LOC115954842 [Quercus lobata]|uniref:uncharacterized protein LOC115954842 n=1 Tax=Quercus lobata TaxID=97700 RepID=UPI001247683E|nr:uncharacterized protein LOC115954842 [Quercus lobata]
MEDTVKKIKIDEPITPTKKIKTVKPITLAKNIVYIPIKSVSTSIIVPVKSICDHSPIESVSIKSIENSFPYNMISDSAYLLALNVFISKIDKDGSRRYGENLLHYFMGEVLLQGYDICLKNAGATYQCVVTILLHDLIHKEVEVYVDDMIVKSKDRERHISVLRKLFERIQFYKLQLNPKKCTFGVTFEKLLGFMVS